MQYTENYSLKLPGYGDNADVGDLNDNTTAIDALIHANRQIEAPAFSTTTAYTAGDMCVYENVLYKFTADKAAGNWDSTKVTVTNLADEVTDAAQSGGTEVEANPVEAATADLHKLKVENTVYGIPDPTVTKTADGNPIEFSDGADAPLVKCVTQITGYQSGTGTPSPDNIRPIVAYTEGEIEVMGKNLVEDKISGMNISSSGVIGSQSSYDVQIAKVVQGVTYTFTTDDSAKVCAFYSSKPVNGSTSYDSSRQTGNSTVTAPITGYIAFRTNANYAYAQCEEGETATDYEPYTFTTHTTTYPSAIYRGSEDVVNGEVTSEWGVVDLGDLTWGYTADYGVFFNTGSIPGMKTKDYTASSGLICDIYSIDPRTALEMADGTMRYRGAGLAQIAVKDSRYIDVVSFKAAMSGHKLAYELATPTTSSVTPTNLPIKSLSGYNHIYSSTGDMEVEYITQGYQPLVDLIQSSQHVYATTEQVVGKWVDGKDVFEKTYTFSSLPSVGDWTAFDEDCGIDTLVDYSLMYTRQNGQVDNNTDMLRVAYNPPTGLGDLCYYPGGVGATHITVRYTKSTATTRSLSKGATDGLKADLSEEKKEIEELLEAEEKTVKEAQNEGEELTENVEEPVEKTEEPVEEPTEKEENER